MRRVLWRSGGRCAAPAPVRLLAPALLLAAACGPPGRAPRDVIAIALPYELTTLDPHAHDTISDFAVLSNVYEPLVTTDADMRVGPGLATNWENPDPLTWIFHLRASARFHSGRSVLARDVVHSLRRVLRSETLEMRSYLQDVLEVQETDERTVRLRTRHSSRILLNKLSFILIAPEGADAVSLERAPNGTGPYAFAGWDRQQRRLRLRRNPAYWGPPPAIREAELTLGQTPDEALRTLSDGRHQLVQCNSKRVEGLLAGSRAHEVRRRANIYVKYLGYDLARDVTPFCGTRPNPFRNPLVRRALHAALDRERLVAQLQSYAVTASQPVPRFIFGFDPSIPEPVHDPEAARALLRRAGIPDGFDVVLHARRVVGEAAFLVRDQLAEVGVRVDVKVLPDDAFFDLANRGEATFWLSRFGAPTGDASNILDNMAHSRDPARHLGMINWGGYASRDLDQSIEASAAIEKEGQRQAALQAMLRRVMEDLVVIPLYNDQDVYVLDRGYAWQPRNDSYVRVAEIGIR